MPCTKRAGRRDCVYGELGATGEPCTSTSRRPNSATLRENHGPGQALVEVDKSWEGPLGCIKFFGVVAAWKKVAVPRVSSSRSNALTAPVRPWAATRAHHRQHGRCTTGCTNRAPYRQLEDHAFRTTVRIVGANPINEARLINGASRYLIGNKTRQQNR